VVGVDLTGVSPDQADRSQKAEDLPSMALDTSTLIIGVLAAITSTGSFAPQAWKIIKSAKRRTYPPACTA
jgi:hypothetical protein